MNNKKLQIAETVEEEIPEPVTKSVSEELIETPASG
jgi:hypothetical protein